MTASTITADTVHAAIAAGHNNIDKLAAQFGVAHSSHELRAAVFELSQEHRIQWDACTYPATFTTR